MFFFQIALVSFIFLVAYIFWLEHRVRTEFEGKRWSLPARVYAQPKDLYVGSRVNTSELINELKSLGYQQAGNVIDVGEYQLAGNRIIFYSRPFEFWDSVETSRLIEIQIQNEQIHQIRDSNGKSGISILRLEPQIIGKIYPVHNEDRILVSYDEIPELLIDALLAVEDKNFFRHHGIDPKGILRAIWTNIRSGELKQGGSSLTQQLVKNYFLNQERTFWRKFNELIMSFLLEYYYSKEEILEAYINEVYLGQQGSHSIHGFGTAAEFYFSRPLGELNLEQLTLLVALVKGASFYNPRKHQKRARERRNLVIDKMLEQQFINETEASSARKTALNVSERPEWSSAKYPAFLDLVRLQLLRDYDINELRNEGLRIFTTLDPVIQEQAVFSLKNRLITIEKQRKLPAGQIQGAVIIADRSTGEILSVVGAGGKME